MGMFKIKLFIYCLNIQTSSHDSLTETLDTNTIVKKDVSLSTVNRFVQKYKDSKGITPIKDMRRYECEHINEVWCGDSSVGPYLKVDGKKQKTYIIALIDDASRMIVGIDILFFNDNFSESDE